MAATVVLTACQSKPATTPSAAKAQPKVATAALTPAGGAKDVAPSSPIVVTASNGKLATVTAKSEKGDTVPGTVAADGGKWTSKGKLSFGATYTVSATYAGTSTPKTVGTFRTADQPGDGESVRTTTFAGDGKTYGVGMPVILKLDEPIAKKDRAAFEKMVKVRSTPAVTGAWGWVSSTEVHFRPKEYWKSGTKIQLTVDTAGRKIGSVWGRSDLSLKYSIGTDRRMTADAKTHRMTVEEDGKQIKDIPVSLGKSEFPSSSGTMVAQDKRANAVFDSSTFGLPSDSPGGYRTKVKDVIRLTTGGEFIHGAPWSVGDQGKRNVSHGCINLSADLANWLRLRAQTGDIVTVKNSGTPLKEGNGWTDWNVSYQKWLAKSATGEQSTQ